MRNLDTNLINGKGVSYRKFKESISISKRNKSITPIKIGDLSNSVPNLNLKSIKFEINENKDSSSISKTNESKQPREYMKLKTAIKKIFKSNNLIWEDKEQENKLLK